MSKYEIALADCRKGRRGHFASTPSAHPAVRSALSAWGHPNYSTTPSVHWLAGKRPLQRRDRVLHGVSVRKAKSRSAENW
jgi:hypothetical protein